MNLQAPKIPPKLATRESNSSFCICSLPYVFSLPMIKIPVKMERKFIKKIRRNCFVDKSSNRDFYSIMSVHESKVLGLGENGPDSID